MSFLDKVSGIFFKEEEVFEEDEFAPSYKKKEQTVPVAMPNERSFWNEREGSKNTKTNLVTIPTRDQAMEMILIKATSYDDLQDIAYNIKNRKVVVVNFEDMDKEIAQRMVDFLSGSVYALDGQPKKVSGGTFIFSSSTVDLSGQIMDGDNAFSADFKAMKNSPWFKGSK